MFDNLIIRDLDPKDISGIVSVHCSLVKKWWKNRQKGLESSYEGLTPLERWGHGGWWLTEEYALPYEKWLNETVGKSYVAEIETNKTRRIVGHCDLVFSEEPEWGKISQLEIIAVHREYQRRGIGTALVQHTMNVAKEVGYPHYVLFANENEIPFYKRQGLEALQTFCCHEIETTSIPPPESKHQYVKDLSGKNYSEVSNYLLVTRPSGDIAARYIWAKNQTFNLPGFGKPEFLKKIELSLQGERFQIILSIEGYVEIWIPPKERNNHFLILETLRISGNICRKLGANKLTTWLPQNFTELIKTWRTKQTYSSTILHKWLS